MFSARNGALSFDECDAFGVNRARKRYACRVKVGAIRE